MQILIFKIIYIFVRYPNLEDRIFNHDIADNSVVQWQTPLTISDSFETGSPVKTEIVTVVSLSTTDTLNGKSKSNTFLLPRTAAV